MDPFTLQLTAQTLDKIEREREKLARKLERHGRGNPALFDRCVKDVRASLKKYARSGNAYAICSAAGTRDNPPYLHIGLREVRDFEETAVADGEQAYYRNEKPTSTRIAAAFAAAMRRRAYISRVTISAQDAKSLRGVYFRGFRSAFAGRLNPGRKGNPRPRIRVASVSFDPGANKTFVRIVTPEFTETYDLSGRVGKRQVLSILRPVVERQLKEFSNTGRRRRNAGGYDSIRPGDRVTISNRFGQKRTGRVVMRGPAGWVLNMGGRYGTPDIATPSNFVKVSHGNFVKVRRKNAGGRGRRNPIEAAQQTFYDKHGRASDELVKITTPMHEHSVLAGMGELIKLVVISPRGHKVTLSKFGVNHEGKPAILSMNEEASQLFIDGGDQSVDLGLFGIVPPYHESETLGQVRDVYYYTTKDHLGDEGGEATYHHRFGGIRQVKLANGKKKRMRSPLPDLIYDVRNKLLSFSGGGYTIPDEGIAN